MMTLRDVDMRPHPYGLVEHPNWDAVRDRHAERICNWHQRQVIEAEEAARRKARLERRPIIGRARLHTILSGLAVALAVGVAWFLALSI